MKVTSKSESGKESKKERKTNNEEITMHASVRNNLQSWTSRAALGGDGRGEPTLSTLSGKDE